MEVVTRICYVYYPAFLEKHDLRIQAKWLSLKSKSTLGLQMKDLMDLTLFELRSFLGRMLIDRRPKLYSNNNYLHLGCGWNPVDGYVNADFFNVFYVRKSKNYTKKLQWQLDLRYPMECDDNVFDGVFTEHTLEHLTPLQANNLLKELYRVMKRNAVIRITVPDLEKYIKFYIGEYDGIDVEAFKKMFDTGCSAIRNTTQNYKHKSVWDFDELKRCMEEAGFDDIQKMDFGVSNDEHLKLDLESRVWETFYLEGRKA